MGDHTITYGKYDHPSLVSHTKQSPDTHFEAQMLNPTFNPNAKKLPHSESSTMYPLDCKSPDDAQSMLVSPTTLNDAISPYPTYTMTQLQPNTLPNNEQNGFNDMSYINPIKFNNAKFEYAGNMGPPKGPPAVPDAVKRAAMNHAKRNKYK